MNLKSLKSKQKISLTSFIAVFLFADLVTMQYLQSSMYTLIQYISLAIVVGYVLLKIKYIRVQDYIFLAAAFILAFCIVISSYMNHINPAALRSCIYYAALIFTMCIFLVESGNMGKLDKVLLGGRRYLLIVAALNDLLMLVMPETFYNISGRNIGTTLLGNKFNVSYSHLMLMFLLIFAEKNEKKRNKKVVIYAVLMSILCVFVDCNTTLLACWVFVILYFLPEHLKMVASKPIVFIVIFFLSGFLLLSFSSILTWGPVKHLIVDVLHRDATLTGRMQVYSYIYRIVFQKKWLGYGYETNIVLSTSKWYANAQNALWDFIICYGFITATVLTVYMMMSVFRYFKYNKKEIKKSSWIIFSMLYVYIFMGIGEITYNKQFFFFIAVLWACCSVKSNNTRRKKVRIR